MPILQDIARNTFVDFRAIDVTELNLGYQVIDQPTDEFWVLAASDSAVDHTTVEEVRGRPDLRWLATGQFAGVPVAGGIWRNPLTQYVSPTGDDSQDGLGWPTAKKYLATAVAAVIDAGGGEVHFAQGTSTQADRQGLWLRDDGVTVPGWFSTLAPIKFVGYGSAISPFGYTPCGGLVGGATYTQGRFNPSLWICSSRRNVLAFDSVGFGAAPSDPSILSSSSTAVRLGWDYQRGADFAPKFQSITSWARVTSGSPPGVATLAVTASTFPVVSMSRLSGVVTVNFTNTDPVACWQGGTPGTTFDIAGTPGGFPAGTFTVDTLISGTSFQYTQAGADIPLAAATGTITSTNCKADDRIEVVSTDSEVPSTTYKVTSVPNGHTLVVIDYYGQGGRTPTVTVPNPGALVLQDRSFRQSIALTSFVRCQAEQLNVPDSGAFTGELGPTVDVGSMTDGRLVFREICIGGGGPNTGSGVNVLDPDRSAWMLSDGGGAGGGNSFFVKHARPVGGGIRVWTDGTSVDVDDVQADIGVPLIPPPIVEFCGTAPQPHSLLVATRSFQTDRGTVLDPDFVCDKLLPANVYVMDAEIVNGPGTVVSGETALGWSSNRIKSPLQLAQAGYWADRRIAGQHPSNYRSLGLLQAARYKNLVTQDPAGWTHLGTTLTAGQADPFRGTAAIRLDSLIPGVGMSVTLATADVATRAVGDRWAFGCWVRGDTALRGASTVNGVLVLSYDHGTSNGPFTTYDGNQITASTPFAFAKNVPFLGDGEWQWCSCSGTLATVDNASAVSNALVQYTDAMTIYRPTLVKVPVGDMTDDEFAEFVLTLRHQSDYLEPHTVGTDNGVPFIGHGGLGVDSSVLVNPSGAPGSLTKLLPVLDSDGSTISGYAPVYPLGGPRTTAAQTSGMAFGSNITDASATINPGSAAASAYLAAAATFTANRSTTVGTTGAFAGLTVTFFRYDLTAHTWALINGGPGAGTLFTFASGPVAPQAVTVTFDGTDWVDPTFYFLGY
jgi:hypothetical protein